MASDSEWGKRAVEAIGGRGGDVAVTHWGVGENVSTMEEAN
jgi:hypothetical protein